MSHVTYTASPSSLLHSSSPTMKRLFRPKSSKSTQPNTIPTPVPSEQFRSIQYLRTQSEDPSYDDLNLHAPLPPIPNSQSAPYPSPLSVNTTNQLYPASHNNSQTGTNSPRHSAYNLLTPASNPFKRKQHVHATTTILRSLDPDDASLHRSRSPSLESIPKTNDVDRPINHRLAEPERDLDQHNSNELKHDDRRYRDHRVRDQEHYRPLQQDGFHPERLHQERHEDRDKPLRKEKHKEKEKRRGIFSRDKDKDKDKDRNGSAELTRMIGYLTATASEDWSLVLEVCERASVNEAAAKEACKALRREFKYAEPGAQLSAARLWAIMLQNCSETFLAQASGKKFLDSLEEVLSYGGTSPVVRERLMEVLAAAAYSHPNGYRNLWRKLKAPHMPEEGVPFDANDSILNFPQSIAPAINLRSTDEVIPPHEDMRRLFEECEIGRGNAQLLNQALTYARPEELSGPVFSEWHRKCRNSHDFIMAQIPWATAQADHSREEIRLLYGENGEVEGNKIVSKEEELLAALLGANEELLEAFRIYDDLQRLGIMEQEEKEVQERSRKEIRIDRTKINYIGDDGSLYEHHPSLSNSLAVASGGNSPSGSRSASPAPFTPAERERPPRSHQPSSLPGPISTPHYTPSKSSTPPSIAPLPNVHPNAGNLRVPLGPRQARSSRSPSPEPLSAPSPLQYSGSNANSGSISHFSLPSVNPPVPSLPVNPVVSSVQASTYPQTLGHIPAGLWGPDVKQLAKLSLDTSPAAGERGQSQGLSLAGGNRSYYSNGSDVDAPIVPSDKAKGKRRAIDEEFEEHNSDEFLDNRSSACGDSSDDERSNGYGTQRRRRAPVVYAYDAAADRARELRREIGIPSPTVTKPPTSISSPPSVRPIPSFNLNLTTNWDGIKI